MKFAAPGLTQQCPEGQQQHLGISMRSTSPRCLRVCSQPTRLYKSPQKARPGWGGAGPGGWERESGNPGIRESRPAGAPRARQEFRFPASHPRGMEGKDGRLGMPVRACPREGDVGWDRSGAGVAAQVQEPPWLLHTRLGWTQTAWKRSSIAFPFCDALL